MTLPTIERGTFLVIRTDGSEEVIREKPKIPAIGKAIGAETLDFVSIGKLVGFDLVMAVDDAGYEFEVIDKSTGDAISSEDEVSRPGGHFEHVPTRPKRPANRKATALYWAICIPGTTHEIVGDVAICHDSDFAA